MSASIEIVFPPVPVNPAEPVVFEAQARSLTLGGYAYEVAYGSRVVYEYSVEGGTPAVSEAGLNVKDSDSSLANKFWTLDLGYLPVSYGPEDTVNLKFYIVELGWEIGQPLPSTYLAETWVKVSGAYDRIYESASPVRIETNRRSDSIELLAEMPEGTSSDETFQGVYFYASLTPGGPYIKVNGIPTREYTTISRSSGPESVVEERVGDLKATTRVSYTQRTESYKVSLNSADLEALDATGRYAERPVEFVEGARVFAVATAVYLVFEQTDTNKPRIFETPPTREIQASFVSPYRNDRILPTRNRDDALASMVTSLLRRKPDANIYPGSVYRDIFDAVSQEIEYGYMIQDLLANTVSWDLLSDFDDPNGDGISDSVDQTQAKSQLKQALGLSSTDVQLYIDALFDAKASDCDLVRLPATSASGQVTVYTQDIPEAGFSIEQGTVMSAPASATGYDGDISFTTSYRVSISYDNRSQYFNESRQRYEILVPVVCSETGTIGNVPPRTILVLESGLDPSKGVINYQAMIGGASVEGNRALALRGKLRYSGTDTGTSGGYALSASSVPGVRQVRVVSAGDSLMKRDWDPQSRRNEGGMVDIYVKGFQQKIVEEKFALGASTGVSTLGPERFYVISPSNMILRTTNPQATFESPIIDVVSVYNATQGEYYKLDNLEIGMGDGDMIKIDPLVPQNKVIGMKTQDVIYVVYSLRAEAQYIFAEAPVTRIVRIQSGTQEIGPAYYRLQMYDNPLYEGGSAKSKYGVAFDPIFLQNFGAYQTESVSGETFSAKVGTPQRLSMKGVDLTSVRVYLEEDGSLEDMELDVDYSLDYDEISQSAFVIIEPEGKANTGDAISLNYNHSKNLTAVYEVDGLVKNVQGRIEETRHSCANVMVKSGIRNGVEVKVSVLRRPGSSEGGVRSSIQNVIARMINTTQMGDVINLDRVIAAVRSLPDVYKVFYPSKFRRASGSFIPLEVLGRNITYAIYDDNTSTGVVSYITARKVLNNNTYDGGAPSGLFKAVYEDGMPLVPAKNPSMVSSAPGQFYILGDGRVIVSTSDGVPPQVKTLSASYFTYSLPESQFADDIATSPVEYLYCLVDDIEVDASTEASISVRT